MADWAPKRFWKEAGTQAAEGGWIVTLDGRPVNTPGRRPLVVPSERLARAIADEWDAQEDLLRPMTMPMTRSANSAIDKVATQRGEVAAYIAEYGATDLLCYRADGPEALVRRQAESWDALLDWAAASFDARLVVTSGIVPVAQPESALARLRAEVDSRDDFALTSLHDLVMLSGSLVIGLAAQEGLRPPEELWALSRVDEEWQQSQWGVDEEAATAAMAKRADFLHAARFHVFSQSHA